MNVRNSLFAAILGLTSVMGASTMLATAADNVELGLLTCDVEGGVGLILGSKKDMTCIFQNANKNLPDDLYTGAVKKLGLDIGVTAQSIVKWVVLGANVDASAPGSLAGDYAGVSATASVGLGVGANALIGGSDDGIILQPFSVEGSEGLNLAVGFAKFKLRAVR
jgi:hypothetical protein